MRNLLSRLPLALLAFAGSRAIAQTEAACIWSPRAEAAQKALVECFWNERTDLFEVAYPKNPDEPRFHYWWQAHAIEALVSGFERSGNRRYLDRATKVWAGVKRRNGGVTNDYNDDMLWMGLALQRLQAHTGDATLRRDVRTLWQDVKKDWSASQGGGIAWSKLQLDYKNAPANAPAVILGVRLHRDSRDPADLAFGKQVYDWLDATLVDPNTGFVWDGKNRQGDGKTDKGWAFSYNQGVRIGAGVELFRATGQARYLEDAAKTFEAMVARLTNGAGVLKEHGKGDGGLFKGILVHYLGELFALDPAAHTKEREFLMRQAESVWASLERTSETSDTPLLFAADWSKPAALPVDLSVQLSGILLLEQMARIEKLCAAAPAPSRSKGVPR
jgi:predicted alpha-1,6-mannanase (GH76 family)